MTIRELMAIVFVIALAIAGLTSGGILASIVIALCWLLVVCLSIVAFVGRGPARVLSIGFCLPVLWYALSVSVKGESELQLANGALPTTRLMSLIYEPLSRAEYTDFVHDEPVSLGRVKAHQMEYGADDLPGN